MATTSMTVGVKALKPGDVAALDGKAVTVARVAHGARVVDIYGTVDGTPVKVTRDKFASVFVTRAVVTAAEVLEVSVVIGSFGRHWVRVARDVEDRLAPDPAVVALLETPFHYSDEAHDAARAAFPNAVIAVH